MKKLLILICTVSILLVLSACGGEDADTTYPQETIYESDDPTHLKEPDFYGESGEPFPGKIAIITLSTSGDPVAYDSAEEIFESYGDEKIVHIIWPDSVMSEQEQMEKIALELREDQTLKGIVVNQALPGTTSAFELLRQEREDIFIVFIATQDSLTASAELADFCMMQDELGMGFAMVDQAYKLGAETFVHYSFMRHMSQSVPYMRRNLIEERCTELGISFIDATAPDPTSDAGISGAQQFILDDVILMVNKYGKDTAFFATNCSMQSPLIEIVVKTGAIYPQPCCPSPAHGFPSAMNSIDPDWDKKEWWIAPRSASEENTLIAAIIEVLTEKDMLGRLSTWPENYSYTMTNAAVEYTIRYLNGEAPREVDAEILRQIIVDNVGVEAYLTPYVDDYPYTENGNGKTYNNFLLLRMDYITFE